MWFWYAVFIEHGPAGDNQGCLKESLKKVG